MSPDLSESREYVLAKAMENIARVEHDSTYVNQAKQVNVALQSIVACERNMIMLAILNKNSPPKGIIDADELQSLPVNGVDQEG